MSCAKLICFISLILVGANVYSAKSIKPTLDVCRGDRDVERKIKIKPSDLKTYCHDNVESYLNRYRAGEIDFVSLYYLQGRDSYSYNGSEGVAPLISFKLASNHQYIDGEVLEGIRRNAMSVCHMFEQIRKKRLNGKKRYDLSKLVNGNKVSISVLIGGSESNSFLYTNVSAEGVSIDMNNNEFCNMRKQIETYLDSKDAYINIKSKKVKKVSDHEQ
ncbi:hypothetical protein N9N67_01790 [Bacteriovoracaceae bacterium]|nr:hypothetical protein [Bacteriovoracaceae bacterium]